MRPGSSLVASEGAWPRPPRFGLQPPGPRDHAFLTLKPVACGCLPEPLEMGLFPAPPRSALSETGDRRGGSEVKTCDPERPGRFLVRPAQDGTGFRIPAHSTGNVTAAAGGAGLRARVLDASPAQPPRAAVTTPETGQLEQQDFTSHRPGGGSPRSRGRVGRLPISFSFDKGTNPSWGAPPSQPHLTLTTSRRPHIG